MGIFYDHFRRAAGWIASKIMSATRALARCKHRRRHHRRCARRLIASWLSQRDRPGFNIGAFDRHRGRVPAALIFGGFRRGKNYT
jgi:hypothetical protein